MEKQSNCDFVTHTTHYVPDLKSSTVNLAFAKTECDDVNIGLDFIIHTQRAPDTHAA